MAAPTNELLLAREHRRMLQETERLNRENEERLRRETYLSPAARTALQRARATEEDISRSSAVIRARATEEDISRSPAVIRARATEEDISRSPAGIRVREPAQAARIAAIARTARRRVAEQNGPITSRNNAGRIIKSTSRKRNFKKYHKGTPKKENSKNKKRRLSTSKSTRKS
jgi:hypothetical protein